jgi:hypothetical protein
MEQSNLTVIVKTFLTIFIGPYIKERCFDIGIDLTQSLKQ